MNTQRAIETLAKEGYKAVPLNDVQVSVQDPYCGYNSGKYGVDGYNTVIVNVNKLFKFLADRS